MYGLLLHILTAPAHPRQMSCKFLFAPGCLKTLCADQRFLAGGIPLKVLPDFNPHERHASIKHIPTEKAKQRAVAVELADKAMLIKAADHWVCSVLTAFFHRASPLFIFVLCSTGIPDQNMLIQKNCPPKIRYRFQMPLNEVRKRKIQTADSCFPKISQKPGFPDIYSLAFSSSTPIA